MVGLLCPSWCLALVSSRVLDLVAQLLWDAASTFLGLSCSLSCLDLVSQLVWDVLLSSSILYPSFAGRLRPARLGLGPFLSCPPIGLGCCVFFAGRLFFIQVLQHQQQQQQQCNTSSNDKDTRANNEQQTTKNNKQPCGGEPTPFSTVRK